MAIPIEPCPFCNSNNLHISHRIVSHAIVCESCKSSGPHRRSAENALREWNQASKLLMHGRSVKEPSVHNHLHELEDTVKSLVGLFEHS